MFQSWKEIIAEETNKPYFQRLSSSLLEDSKHHIIYPSHADVFNAFKYCPLNKVKSIIIGQDPYHGLNQAHGLAFSVQSGFAIPPSLSNIFKELKSDLGIEPPTHGCLIQWAQQGVLLLNTILTVKQGQPGSYKNSGWEQFTNRIITEVSNLDRPIVHILWGSFARSKKELLTNFNHLILEGSHPSPLSANRSGFFGGKYFSKCNHFLSSNNIEPINWEII